MPLLKGHNEILLIRIFKKNYDSQELQTWPAYRGYLVKILKKNHFIFFEVLPFANLTIENLISQKPLQLGASNLVSL